MQHTWDCIAGGCRKQMSKVLPTTGYLFKGGKNPASFLLEVLPSLPGSLLHRADSNALGSLQTQLLEDGFGDLHRKLH